MSSARPTGVSFAPGHLLLDGQPDIVLCASVFSFRLPPHTWEHRLREVAQSGYRMIDLYVPWAMHEPEEGHYDFSSPQRDVAAFVDLAGRHGLLVMLRPGPYICSELDGGGLPAWLHDGRLDQRGTHRDSRYALRTLSEPYMSAARRWLTRACEYLAPYQTDRGGPIALVQVDNELDFYGCADPTRYQEALAQTCREAGITVPLIACSGQGDVVGSGGDAADVVPTVNLYPNDRAPWVEEETRAYYHHLAERGLPLMVTETNRLHLTLRREVLAGARLLAPYLQVSGTNRALNPSTGNWGNPGNAMTYDYDFGGYLTADGRRRGEYAQAQQLCRTLRAWGADLAIAQPEPLPADCLHLSEPLTQNTETDAVAAEKKDLSACDPSTRLPAPDLVGGALHLPHGGCVVGIANTTTQPLYLRHCDSQAGEEAGKDVTVPPLSCPLWPLGASLRGWGIGATVSANAELVESPYTVPDAPVPTFVFAGDEAWVTVRIDGAETEHTITVGQRQRCESATGPFDIEVQPAQEIPEEAPLQWHEHEVYETLSPSMLTTVASDLPVRLQRTATASSWRRHHLDVKRAAHLWCAADDLVRIYDNGQECWNGTPFGVPTCLPLAAGSHEIAVEAQTWGHANFDDARMPALNLGSPRGIHDLVLTTLGDDATGLWDVTLIPGVNGLGRCDDAMSPIRTLGGWSSTALGQPVRYQRHIDAAWLRARVDAARQGQQVDSVGSSVMVMSVENLRADVRVSCGDLTTLLTPQCPSIVVEVGEAERQHGLTIVVDTVHRAGGFCDAVRWEWGVRLTPSQDEPEEPRYPLAYEYDLTAMLARALAERPDGCGVLLDLSGEDVEVMLWREEEQISRHLLSERVATSGGDRARAWITAADCEQGGQYALTMRPLSVTGGRLRGLRWAYAAS